MGGPNMFGEARLEDGRIDLSKLPKETPKEVLENLKKADKDNDGFLSQEELRASFRGQRREGGFGPRDSGDNNGRPSREGGFGPRDSGDNNGRPSRNNRSDRPGRSEREAVVQDRLIKTEGETPGNMFVFIPANQDFQFSVSVDNREKGEKAAIKADYCLAKYSVTNKEYKAFIDDTKYEKLPKYWKDGNYPEGKDNHPVVQVSFEDAKAYCDWLTAKDSNWTYRLPTEAEWENAAAGPNKLAYPWGISSNVTYTKGVLTSEFNYNGVFAAKVILDKEKDASILSINKTGLVSNWKSEDAKKNFLATTLFRQTVLDGGNTTPVDLYQEAYSPYGCYDMAGNTFDWTCSSITASNGAENGEVVNAIRGGSWYSNAKSCSVINRGEGRFPNGSYITVGFRVAAQKK